MCGLSVVILVTALAAGCGRDEPAPPPPPPPDEAAKPPPEPEPEPTEEPLDWSLFRELLDEYDPQPVAAPKAAPTVAKAPEPTAPDAPQVEAKARTYKELIVGKWRITGGGMGGDANMTIEFKADGSIDMSGATGGHAPTVTYKWDSADTFTMTIAMDLPDGSSHEGTVKCTIKSLDESSMTIVGKPEGSDREDERTFTRVTD